MYETYTDKDRLNEAFDITGFSKKDFRNQGPALFGDTEGGTRSELANEYENKGFFGKRKMRKDFMKNDLWDMPLDSGVINERRGNAKIAPNTFKGPFSKPGESNPTADPKYIPTEEDFNFAYGGYIPAYMAYGGYMPDYGYGGMTYFNPGGVVGPNPEFVGPQENNFGADADNNGIPDYLEVKDGKSEMAINNVGTTQDKEGPTSYTLEEQTAKTLDLGVGARNVNKGLRGATNFLEMANFAKKRQAQNPKFMYAQDIDRQLTYKGRADQEGVDKKAGFETGRTFTKMGGAQNTNDSKAYSKGKVYSLTMDEIREIQRNGGSVKFIK